MNLFGANWKTSTSGYIETICVIIIAIGYLPAEIWTNPKVWIPAVLILIAKTVKDTLTKDKNVTGGSTQQTLSGAVANPGTQGGVDTTLLATVDSNEEVTSEQMKVAKSLKNER